MVINGLNNLFSLDISDGAIRLVKLEKRGKKIFIVSYAESGLEPNVISNGEVKNEETFIAQVKKLLKNSQGKKIKGKNLITVLPETKTFIQIIKTPAANNDEQLLDFIKQEIKNHIPLTFEEIYLDWQVLEKTKESFKILIGAAPRDIVDNYFRIIEKCGLTPHVFEIEAAAIIRSLLAKNDTQPKVIIDFGATRTGLIVCDHGMPEFTVSLPISGKEITATITSTLQLDPAKAEKAKVVCGLDPQKCDGALRKILLTTVNNLAKEIKKSIFYYQSNYNNQISEVILCGGGANFSEIDKLLSEKLKLPVKIGNPLTNLSLNKKLSLNKNQALSFTTAIGLALRAFDKE
ncbi:MAG: type IV pilus assembly protein PilM [Candidatus Buchananbacteria bacterium]